MQSHPSRRRVHEGCFVTDRGHRLSATNVAPSQRTSDVLAGQDAGLSEEPVYIELERIL
jgi:hypothetical protein